MCGVVSLTRKCRSHVKDLCSSIIVSVYDVRYMVQQKQKAIHKTLFFAKYPLIKVLLSRFKW